MVYVLRRGSTQVGPHRDDLQVLLGGRSARDFASQGQQRTAALALKLAQAQVLATGRGEAPLVLLDDCLSELDPARRRRVLELTAEFDQILLTTAGEVPRGGPEPALVVRLPAESAERG